MSLIFRYTVEDSANVSILGNWLIYPYHRYLYRCYLHFMLIWFYDVAKIYRNKFYFTSGSTARGNMYYIHALPFAAKALVYFHFVFIFRNCFL